MWQKAKEGENMGKVRLLLILFLFILSMFVADARFDVRVSAGDWAAYDLQAPSGTGYAISWWTVDSGANVIGAGGYRLGGTIGQPDAGKSSAGGYTLTGGFWPGAAEIGQTSAMHLPWMTHGLEGERQ